MILVYVFAQKPVHADVEICTMDAPHLLNYQECKTGIRSVVFIESQEVPEDQTLRPSRTETQRRSARTRNAKMRSTVD